MKQQTMSIWQVRLPVDRIVLEVTVLAPDKLIASKIAARQLQLSWKRHASYMDIERLRKAEEFDVNNYPGPATAADAFRAAGRAGG